MLQVFHSSKPENIPMNSLNFGDIFRNCMVTYYSSPSEKDEEILTYISGNFFMSETISEDGICSIPILDFVLENFFFGREKYSEKDVKFLLEFKKIIKLEEMVNYASENNECEFLNFLFSSPSFNIRTSEALKEGYDKCLEWLFFKVKVKLTEEDKMIISNREYLPDPKVSNFLAKNYLDWRMIL